VVRKNVVTNLVCGVDGSEARRVSREARVYSRRAEPGWRKVCVLVSHAVGKRPMLRGLAGNISL